MGKAQPVKSRRMQVTIWIATLIIMFGGVLCIADYNYAVSFIKLKLQVRSSWSFIRKAQLGFLPKFTIRVIRGSDYVSAAWNSVESAQKTDKVVDLVNTCEYIEMLALEEMNQPNPTIPKSDLQKWANEASVNVLTLERLADDYDNTRKLHPILKQLFPSP